MTTLDLKKLASAVKARARELARSVAERNQIAIERPGRRVRRCWPPERQASAQALAQYFRLLREVEAASRSMRGTHRICLRCREEIAPKRLQAVPWVGGVLSVVPSRGRRAIPRPRLARAA